MPDCDPPTFQSPRDTYGGKTPLNPCLPDPLIKEVQELKEFDGTLVPETPLLTPDPILLVNDPYEIDCWEYLKTYGNTVIIAQGTYEDSVYLNVTLPGLSSEELSRLAQEGMPALISEQSRKHVGIAEWVYKKLPRTPESELLEQIGDLIAGKALTEEWLIEKTWFSQAEAGMLVRWVDAYTIAHEIGQEWLAEYVLPTIHEYFLREIWRRIREGSLSAEWLTGTVGLTEEEAASLIPEVKEYVYENRVSADWLMEKANLLRADAETLAAVIEERIAVLNKLAEEYAKAMLRCYWWNMPQTAECADPEMAHHEDHPDAIFSATVPWGQIRSDLSQADADNQALTIAQSRLNCFYVNDFQIADCLTRPGKDEAITEAVPNDRESLGFDLPLRVGYFVVLKGTFISWNSKAEANEAAIFYAYAQLNCFYANNAIYRACEHAIARFEGVDPLLEDPTEADIYAKTSGQFVYVPRGFFTSQLSTADATDKAITFAESLLECCYMSNKVTVSCEGKTFTYVNPITGETIVAVPDPNASPVYTYTVERGAYTSCVSQEEADSFAEYETADALGCYYCNVEVEPTCVPEEEIWKHKADPESNPWPLQIYDQTWPLNATVGIEGGLYCSDNFMIVQQLAESIAATRVKDYVIPTLDPDESEEICEYGNLSVLGVCAPSMGYPFEVDVALYGNAGCAFVNPYTHKYKPDLAGIHPAWGCCDPFASFPSKSSYVFLERNTLMSTVSQEEATEMAVQMVAPMIRCMYFNDMSTIGCDVMHSWYLHCTCRSCYGCGCCGTCPICGPCSEQTCQNAPGSYLPGTLPTCFKDYLGTPDPYRDNLRQYERCRSNGPRIDQFLPSSPGTHPCVKGYGCGNDDNPECWNTSNCAQKDESGDAQQKVNRRCSNESEGSQADDEEEKRILLYGGTPLSASADSQVCVGGGYCHQQHPECGPPVYGKPGDGMAWSGCTLGKPSPRRCVWDTKCLPGCCNCGNCGRNSYECGCCDGPNGAQSGCEVPFGTQWLFPNLTYPPDRCDKWAYGAVLHWGDGAYIANSPHDVCPCGGRYHGWQHGWCHTHIGSMDHWTRVVLGCASCWSMSHNHEAAAITWQILRKTLWCACTNYAQYHEHCKIAPWWPYYHDGFDIVVEGIDIAERVIVGKKGDTQNDVDAIARMLVVDDICFNLPEVIVPEYCSNDQVKATYECEVCPNQMKTLEMDVSARLMSCKKAMSWQKGLRDANGKLIRNWSMLNNKTQVDGTTGYGTSGIEYVDVEACNTCTLLAKEWGRKILESICVCLKDLRNYVPLITCTMPEAAIALAADDGIAVAAADAATPMLAAAAAPVAEDGGDEATPVAEEGGDEVLLDEDDPCAGKTGPQGPRGRTGLKGPQGPQGPMGPAGSVHYTRNGTCECISYAQLAELINKAVDEKMNSFKLTIDETGDWRDNEVGILQFLTMYGSHTSIGNKDGITVISTNDYRVYH